MVVIRGIFGLVRGVVFLGALAILVGTILLNPLLTGWVGGYLTNKELQSRGVQEAREATFRTVCPEYFNASFLDRWTSLRISKHGWCEDFKHRLP